jgi:hypothetical protein
LEIRPVKYLLLVYGAETDYDDQTRNACYHESAALARDLKAEGRFIATNPLLPVATAKTVRVRGGTRTVTDGPFAETREQLGGYFLIDAGDMEEAIEIAGRIPGGRVGCVEVRPVLEIAGLPED